MASVSIDLQIIKKIHQFFIFFKAKIYFVMVKFIFVCFSSAFNGLYSNFLIKRLYI